MGEGLQQVAGVEEGLISNHRGFRMGVQTGVGIGGRLHHSLTRVSGCGVSGLVSLWVLRKATGSWYYSCANLSLDGASSRSVPHP